MKGRGDDQRRPTVSDAGQHPGQRAPTGPPTMSAVRDTQAGKLLQGLDDQVPSQSLPEPGRARQQKLEAECEERPDGQRCGDAENDVV